MQSMRRTVRAAFLLATLVAGGAVLIAPRVASADDANTCYSCSHCDEPDANGTVHCTGCVVITCPAT